MFSLIVDGTLIKFILSPNPAYIQLNTALWLVVSGNNKLFSQSQAWDVSALIGAIIGTLIGALIGALIGDMRLKVGSHIS